MREKFIKLYKKYTTISWLKSLGKTELNKPFEFVNEALLLLTFLSTRGINPSLWEIVGTYCLLFVGLVILGKIIRDWGILKYTTELGSMENPTLQDVRDTVHRIEKQLNMLK